jgi:hypothetical protein
VPPGQVQQHLRACLARWGRPAGLRVDNGSPWGSWSDLPPGLALWLIGLGIDLIWNPPRCPQANGVVERSQGVAQAWAEPGQCSSVAELQQRLDREDRLWREEYPYRLGQSRTQVWPQLVHSGRAYSVGWEEQAWAWSRVKEHLEEYAVVRRVDGSGKIGLYQGKVYVGTVHRRREVVVQFDGAAEEWVISNPVGVELCRRPLRQFDAARLRGL